MVVYLNVTMELILSLYAANTHACPQIPNESYMSAPKLETPPQRCLNDGAQLRFYPNIEEYVPLYNRAHYFMVAFTTA